jgi:hypothetical protein
VIHDAGNDKQQVGETVDVTHQHPFDRRPKRDDPSLCPPADGAGHMQRRSGGRPAWKDEPGERRQLGFEPIDECLQPSDVRVGDRGFGHPPGDSVVRVRQFCANGEQVPLDRGEQNVKIRIENGSPDEPQPGVELVDFAVRVHARIRLAHARAVKQRRFAAVARSSVDFHGGLSSNYTTPTLGAAGVIARGLVALCLERAR